MQLIDSNDICTNDLILAEIVPSLKARKENELIRLFESIEKMKLDIDWKEIIAMQTYNLNSRQSYNEA